MKEKAYLLRPPTPESLNRAAERYMGRFAASEASLRRVLQMKLRRVVTLNPAFANDLNLQDQLKSTIEAIICRYVASGILNDATYADMKRSSLRRAGRSKTAIVQRLHAKGIALPIIRETMDRERDEANSDTASSPPEYQAALIFARRKKFVRSAKRGHDPLLRNKQIAAMARAGFSFRLIKKVLDADDDDVAVDAE